MATNKGTEGRQGTVKGQSQVYNPATGNYIRRDSTTGKLVAVKATGAIAKGVAKINVNPSIKKSTALKAEKAVIKVKNDSLKRKG